MAKAQTSKYNYDFLFTGPEGLDEHVGVAADDLDDFKAAVAEMRIIITDLGAQPKYSKPKFKAEVAVESPMDAAAAATNFVQKECPNGCAGYMNFKPGTKYTGEKSRKTGKAYSSLYECPTCKHVVWANDIKKDA